MDLLIGLASNVWSVLLIVFFFEGSIFVHELGHYLAARWRGATVERFSIGMGKPIFSWHNRQGVEFCFAWLPIGGYVKLPQLADLGAVEGESRIDPETLPSLGLSTKVIVFAAGAAFNVLFAFALASILWGIGFPTEDSAATTRIGYVSRTLRMPDGSKVQSPAAKAHLEPGDVILKVDGRPVSDWFSVQQDLALGSGRTADGRDRLVKLQIQRGDDVMDVDLNPILAGDEKIRRIGVTQAHEIKLGKIPAGSLAAKTGFEPGDRIQAVDTTPVYSSFQLEDYLDTHASVPVTLHVARAGKDVPITVPAHTKLEVLLDGVEAPTAVRLIHENPFKQIRNIAGSAFQFLSGLINPRSDVGINEMSGPVGIVTQYWEVVNSQYPIRMTLWFTILINISLAIFNLLPIPILDGGNIVFALIAKARGRALPAYFINATQSVFAVLLFSMVMYTLFADVRRLLHTDHTDPIVDTPQQAATPSPVPSKP